MELRSCLFQKGSAIFEDVAAEAGTSIADATLSRWVKRTMMPPKLFDSDLPGAHAKRQKGPLCRTHCALLDST